MELLVAHIIALWAGFLLDKLLGDPLWLPHPVVAFGKSISFFTKKLNHGKYRILKGAVTAMLLIATTFIFFFLLIKYSYQISLISGIAIETMFVFYGLAGTTLVKEGKAVFHALDESLEAGRTQVGRIVGRDTSELCEKEIKAATLETLAENLSDGVIAPLFWFALAGIPGMMAYKMINTLDSMIGYKNEKYLLFGRVAARIDDFANYIPARITAFLMAICSGSQRALHFIFKYGNAHSSPNAGYPEAALAGALNVTFGGAHLYFGEWIPKPTIGETQRDFNKNDLVITIKIVRRTEVIFVILLTSIFVVLAF
ncbi:adenosylcobinamide-phosphate synthase CbiB [Draconibacterium orientale]|uniref:adenosylcobinamide-phosphate synthase CbiB n=1 Tax=Draconibacterium orientale TaxID=1168034 RepID=UPI002A0A1B04|nr:adenosylcobinamide-phosphate synthase CbiB [Draconibacterium orientale]